MKLFRLSDTQFIVSATRGTRAGSMPEMAKYLYSLGVEFSEIEQAFSELISLDNHVADFGVNLMLTYTCRLDDAQIPQLNN